MPNAILSGKTTGVTSDKDSTSTTIASSAQLANSKVKKAGDTMTGDLTTTGIKISSDNSSSSKVDKIVVQNDTDLQTRTLDQMKSDLGVPTLSSSVSSTSTTTAATSSAVKQAYDLANSAGSISDDTAALLGLDPDDNPTVNDALTSIINLGNEYKYVAEKTIYQNLFNSANRTDFIGFLSDYYGLWVCGFYNKNADVQYTKGIIILNTLTGERIFNKIYDSNSSYYTSNATISTTGNTAIVITDTNVSIILQINSGTVETKKITQSLSNIIMMDDENIIYYSRSSNTHFYYRLNLTTSITTQIISYTNTNSPYYLFNYDINNIKNGFYFWYDYTTSPNSGYWTMYFVPISGDSKQITSSSTKKAITPSTTGFALNGVAYLIYAAAK